MIKHQLSIDGIAYSICLPDAETDYIQGKIIQEDQPYELEMLRDMAARLQAGDLVLDIGANIGNHALYLANVVGCEVHAFEPNKHLCEAIKQSAILNSIEDAIIVHQVGAASKSGFAHFDKVDESNLGAQSLEVSLSKHDEIKLVSLDEFVFSKPVTAIKIDVEGMELSVLDGALSLLKKDKPLLYVEALTIDLFNKTSSFLKMLGYFYCETFNATPTHIYIHKDNISAEELGDFLFEKQLSGSFHEDKIKDMQTSLLASNRKYRESTERYAVLKEKFDNANKKYRELSDNFNELKYEKLEFENNKKELILSHREKIHELDKEINNKEVDFEREKTKRLEVESHLQFYKEKIELEIALEKNKLDSHLLLKKFLTEQGEDYKVERSVWLEQGKNFNKQVEALRARQEQLESLLDEKQLEVDVLESEKTSFSKNVEVLDGSLEKTYAKNEQLKRQLNEQLQLTELLQCENSVLKSRVAEVEGERLAHTAQLSTANVKYRQLTSEQVPVLREKLEQQGKRATELYQRAEKLNKDLKKQKQLTRQIQYDLTAAKSSATFKAGMYVNAASNSLKDAIKLPVRLLRLRKLKKSQRTIFDQASIVGLPQLSSLPEKESIALSVPERNAYEADSLLRKKNKELRIACIMDEFTYGSYQPEAQLCQLTPEKWQAELEECQPELLFIESAWRGKDELWGSKVGHCSSELQGIVAWCRERKVPTVFWNKEDPIHFETFLNTARLFDFVFTTDMDCIHRYKAALGHDDIYFLPFACQPKVHNPIEKYTRKDAFCFAGAYYVRYPERTRDLESFVSELPAFRPLEIYDRNYGKDHPDYKFPENYQPHIVGTLSFDEIDKAYKGYSYAINLNSIKQSQSMFARRVYELLGSNTLTVSNFSRGLRLIFGDLVLTSDSGSEVTRRLEELQEQGCIDRIRLAGLRKVMTEHTYSHRLNYVVEKVSRQARADVLPSVSVFAKVRNSLELKDILAAVTRQQGVNLSLLLITNSKFEKQAQKIIKKDLPANIQAKVLSAADIKEKNVQALAARNNWVAALLPNDHYGAHYLLDMLLATRYTQAELIGKASWFGADKNDAIKLNNEGKSYQACENIYARRAIISPNIAAQIPAKQWLDQLATWQYSQDKQFAVDCYNYCQDAVLFNTLCTEVDDLVINSGIPLAQLEDIAEATEALANNVMQVVQLTGRALGELLQGSSFNWTDGSLSEPNAEEQSISLTRNPGIKTMLKAHALEISSTLPDGKHEYLYAKKDIPVSSLSELLTESEANSIPVHLETEPGLNLTLVALYLDAKGNRVSHAMLQPNRNNTLHIPEDAVSIRFGLRVYAGGTAAVKRLLLGHIDLEPVTILGQSDVLLLTNHYPSYDDLYRNGFVHSRVKAYAEHNVNVDVFRLRKDEPIHWHEFQNADVTTGSQTALKRMLASGRYRHVLVHFLDSDMWDVLKEFIDNIRVTVWVHGADIQPWYRRKFNITTPEQKEKVKAQSEVRMVFWRGLLKPMPANLHMVFVSNYFSEEVMEDLGFRLPDEQYSVIHNPIDTELFNYIEKDVEQRKKILSIRPYSSRVYANDLTVATILELSKKPYFNELGFRLIGDGALFDETVEPLRRFENVKIEKKFLTQAEIAALHKEYGLFLCPSRYDTQGVSRDEAMTSGLVPLTNLVAAIPDFVDESCAILAPAEDHLKLVEGIEQLYNYPELFKEKAQKAAKRIHQQSRKVLVVEKELNLFCEQLNRKQLRRKE